MSKSMSILLMITGVLLFAIGAFQYRAAKPAPGKAAQASPELEPDPRTKAELTSDSKAYEDGLAFEKYIVQRFNQKYFTVKQWTGDKQVAGYFVEANTNPDLVFAYKAGSMQKTFAVECKWRSNFYKGGFELSGEAQLERYRTYGNENQMPVFVAIGIGGTSSAPNEVFMVPLEAFKTPFMLRDEMIPHKKWTETNFYLDTERMVLN